MDKLKNKIYCFQYDVKEDKMYLQKHNYRQTSNMITIEFDDGENCHIFADNIDKPQYEKSYGIIYVYTFKNDVNYVMDLIHTELLKVINTEKEKVKRLETVLYKITAKKVELKHKYPDGIK